MPRSFNFLIILILDDQIISNLIIIISLELILTLSNAQRSPSSHSFSGYSFCPALEVILSFSHHLRNLTRSLSFSARQALFNGLQQCGRGRFSSSFVRNLFFLAQLF